MTEIVRRMTWAGPNATHLDAARLDALLSREWLVTNGLGGSASGTVAGVVTRRYHGLLVAALPAPHGRVVMLSHLGEQLRLTDGTVLPFGGDEHVGGSEHAGGDGHVGGDGHGEHGLDVPGLRHLDEFRLELGLPVWRYTLTGYHLEKRIVLPHRQNTVHITYRLLAGPGPARLELRPSVNFRAHEAPVDRPIPAPYVLTAIGDRYEIGGPAGLPPLRLSVLGQPGALTLDRGITRDIRYRVEERRGYEWRGPLWSPGYVSVDLTPERLTPPDAPHPAPPLTPHPAPLTTGSAATLVASTEPWETVLALTPAEAERSECERRRRLLQAAPPAARDGLAAELVLAADQFIISPAGRAEDVALAHAAGDEVRTVIAGYHWFTDWGRDTMIGLEGLTLTTGRTAEAGSILRMFARHVRDGLIPNMFPEGENDGLYHTADATLWFFHALDRYLAVTGDRATLRLLLPTLRDIVAQHVRGTRFGIGVDPADGLLRQGADGYQLTWMDAKVGDWVVTPRRGKAVEINALWYNALCLLARWLREERAAEPGERTARDLTERAEQTFSAFNRRFWYAEGGYLYDVVDGEQGDDPACRPNQLFAIALPHPVLDRARWEPVLTVARERLVTPVGLRSLAPGHPDYKPRYFGDLHARDAAYHQGTVWGWLAGPYVDAWLKVYPDDRAGARRARAGFEEHLGEACIGTISEIFDAEAPYTPRGCVAQAWSVAEVLRCLVKTA